MEALFVSEHCECRVQVGLVVEGLSHAHEHDVANPASFIAEVQVGLDDLIQDLRCFKVAANPEFAGGTKRAIRTTADLRRYTQSGAS